MKKIVVLSIIVLFIGANIVSSTSTKIAIDKIEVSQASYIKGFEFHNGSLSGFVNDSLANPLEGALIRVHFHGTYEEDYSDENGYYRVTNIPICYCMKNATCSKESYKTEWVLLAITENTTYDFVLYPLDVYPVFNGSQCNGWWNSPVTVSFVFDPEEVAEIWYDYHGWHQYSEPFVVDENSPIDIDFYWINYEGEQSPHATIILEIDRIPPDTYLQWETYKKSGKWYVKFTLTAIDSISGMDPYLDFYLNDVLQETFHVFWPVFEFGIQWTKILEKVTFGFGCSDNACNYVIEEVNGSDIKASSVSKSSQQSSTTLFFQILQRLMNIK